MKETETDVHIQVADWLRVAKVDFFHPPNGVNVKMGRTQGVLNKMGRSAGVSDIIIVTPPPVGGYVGAALEIKKADGKKPTPAQFAWLNTFRSHGWAADWAKGFDACIEVLTKWGYGWRAKR